MKDLEYFKKELIKILDKKEREEKGIRMSIAALKKAIDKCSTSQELLDLVLQNRDRFADDNGRPLPIVKELSEYVSAKNDKLEIAVKKTDKTPKTNMIKKGESEWGTVYEMENGSPLEAARFLLKNKDGLVENAFTGKNKKGNTFNVGMCWGHERFGLQKIIEKHIIFQKDFDSLEEMTDTIQTILENGNEKFKNKDKIQIDNGKYRLILDKSENGKLVLTVFDNSKMDYEKVRSEEEQESKRKELDFVSQNSLTRNGTPLSATASSDNIAQNNSPVNKKMTYATDVCKSVEDLTNYAKENYGITIKSEDKKGDNTEKILKCFDITERFIKKVPGLEKYVKTIIYGKIDHKTMGYYNQNERLLKVGEFGEDVTEEQVRTGYYGEMKHTVRHEMTHAIQHMIVNEYLSDKKKEQYEQAFKESFRNAYYTGKPKDMAKIANFFLHRVIGGQDFLAAAFDLFKEYKDGDYYRSMYSQFARNLVSEKIVDTALSNLGIDKKRRHFSLKTAVGKNVEELKGATKEVARISKYALSEDAECMADAIADALGSGEKAAPLSKEIMKVVEDIVGSKSIEMLKSLYAKNKTLFVVKKSFADNFMNKRSIPTMQKSIFVRGDFDAYRISDEELKEHSIFAKTEDGFEYDLQNPTENFYYTLKKNLEKSLTWSGHKLQDRTTWNGLKISIENKKGSVRRGVDKDGHQWATKMHFDYGYIRGSEGTDGDHVDCYLGDNMDAKKVYIVHQNDPVTHKYDEDKCMLGFNTLEDAKKAYLMQYDRPGFLGKIDIMDFDEFKEFILLKRNHGKKIIKSYTDFVKSVGENFDFDTMRKVCII